MDNIDRINVQKRDRGYKWRFQLYKKLFYCMCGISVVLTWLLIMALTRAVKVY